jgi:hypothetical protein
MAPVDCVSSPARFLSVRATAFTLVENLHFAPIYTVSSILLRTLPKMADTKAHAVAESVFARNRRRETEINEALVQEAARHEAAVKNMRRLRALRLARESKLNNEQPVH